MGEQRDGASDSMSELTETFDSLVSDGTDPIAAARRMVQFHGFDESSVWTYVSREHPEAIETTNE